MTRLALTFHRTQGREQDHRYALCPPRGWSDHTSLLQQDLSTGGILPTPRKTPCLSHESSPFSDRTIHHAPARQDPSNEHTQTHTFRENLGQAQPAYDNHQVVSQAPIPQHPSQAVVRCLAQPEDPRSSKGPDPTSHGTRRRAAWTFPRPASKQNSPEPNPFFSLPRS